MCRTKRRMRQSETAIGGSLTVTATSPSNHWCDPRSRPGCETSDPVGSPDRGAVTQFRSLWSAEGYRRPLARVCMASRNSRNKGSRGVTPSASCPFSSHHFQKASRTGGAIAVWPSSTNQCSPSPAPARKKRPARRARTNSAPCETPGTTVESRIGSGRPR